MPITASTGRSTVTTVATAGSTDVRLAPASSVNAIGNSMAATSRPIDTPMTLSAMSDMLSPPFYFIKGGIVIIDIIAMCHSLNIRKMILYS